jgi:hypothetical protein
VKIVSPACEAVNHFVKGRMLSRFLPGAQTFFLRCPNSYKSGDMELGRTRMIKMRELPFPYAPPAVILPVSKCSHKLCDKSYP